MVSWRGCRPGCPALCWVGQLGAAQVDLVVRHHPDKFENLLPARDKARAQHVVHEGLGGRGGRQQGSPRHQGIAGAAPVVQNEPVAVVGNAQTVRSLAIGGGGKVGADPGANRAPVYAVLGNNAQFSAASTQ